MDLIEMQASSDVEVARANERAMRSIFRRKCSTPDCPAFAESDGKCEDCWGELHGEPLNPVLEWLILIFGVIGMFATLLTIMAYLVRGAEQLFR
jgi:hypothetical protein